MLQLAHSYSDQNSGWSVRKAWKFPVREKWNNHDMKWVRGECFTSDAEIVYKSVTIKRIMHAQR